MWNTSRAGGVTLTNFDASADAETVSLSETANEPDAEADVSFHSQQGRCSVRPRSRTSQKHPLSALGNGNRIVS
jgi:hypothetical protein